MSETIGFRETREFLGRNGLAKMGGILIQRQADDLYIAPLTSRLQVGRSYMLVPVEMVPDIAKAMLRESDARRVERKAAA